MEIRRDKVAHVLDFLRDLKLVSATEISSVMWLFERTCPFREQLSSSDSIHIHVKVDDTANLPHAAIRNAGGRPESEQTGYAKYAFPAGINAIFSSIPVAEDDRLAGLPVPAKPFLDHAGLDMRKETSTVRRQFDSIPEIARSAGWRHVPQGGTGRAVYCCHTQVNEKHWVYPPANAATFTRPLEFAFGPLVVHASSMGCDLRPIDPAHLRASEAGCCATPGAQTDMPASTASTSCCAPQTSSCCPPVRKFEEA